MELLHRSRDELQGTIIIVTHDLCAAAHADRVVFLRDGQGHHDITNGVEKILYFSAAISVDSLHSQYHVPTLVRKARVPTGFPPVNMGAWNDHPFAIQAIQKIEALVEQ